MVRVVSRDQAAFEASMHLQVSADCRLPCCLQRTRHEMLTGTALVIDQPEPGDQEVVVWPPIACLGPRPEGVQSQTALGANPPCMDWGRSVAFNHGPSVVINGRFQSMREGDVGLATDGAREVACGCHKKVIGRLCNARQLADRHGVQLWVTGLLGLGGPPRCL